MGDWIGLWFGCPDVLSFSPSKITGLSVAALSVLHGDRFEGIGVQSNWSVIGCEL